MQKRRPQSTQAPSCTTFLHKAFSLFQHHSNFFIKNSFDENQYGPEAKIHLDTKIYQDLNTNQGENRKLNAVLEKENTRGNYKNEK
jgi:hypothetical protein